jgi:diphthine-ammonia ligase
MLQQYELKFEHVLYVNLFLASMADFASINATYHKRFRVSPPARVTVEVILPPGRHVRLELIAYVPSQRRKKYSLHVQSLSYWAPANIGPYSQATSVCNMSPRTFNVS